MAADPHGDYHKGEMDIHEQANTYGAFMAMTKWGSLILAVGILFLTVWFCVEGAGFMGAAAAGFVVAVIGVLMLRSKPDAH